MGSKTSGRWSPTKPKLMFGYFANLRTAAADSENMVRLYNRLTEVELLK